MRVWSTGGVDWATALCLSVRIAWGGGWVETCPKEAAGKYMGRDNHHSLSLSVHGIRERWVSSDRRERMV